MKKTIFLLALTLLAALPAGAQQKDHDFEVAKNLDIFNAIYKNLDMLYVDTLNANELVGTGINAMLRSLDPYTEYYPEEKTRDLKTMLTGKYAGIGALIQYNFQLKRVCIGEPYAGMPAAEAGLRKGDLRQASGYSSMTATTNAYVSEHLRGEPGTSFVLTYQRPGLKKPTKVKITRRAIQLPSLPYYGLRPSGMGYINYNQYTEGSAREVRRALPIFVKKRMCSMIRNSCRVSKSSSTACRANAIMRFSSRRIWGSTGSRRSSGNMKRFTPRFRRLLR